MDALPQVGQKYENDTGWEVIVIEIQKLGRGFRVWHESVFSTSNNPIQHNRLKEFQKGYRPCNP